MTKLGLVLIAALAACKARQPPPGATDGTGSQGSGSATATAPVATTDPQGAGHNLSGPRPHQAENCPSSLPNATTRLANTPRGVDVTVTSKDTATAHRIVELSQLHVRGRTAEASHPHDQKHGGPGWIGYCPVLVTNETQVSITPLPDGAIVHVEARSPSRVAELQELIKARAVRLPGYLSS
jgi:TusA-related sulfurtransferase